MTEKTNKPVSTFQTTDSGVLRLIGKELGDFHIIRLLAKGGMGIVYEAEQTSLNRKVALKILPNHFLNEFISIERFRQEAQAIANLHHPNIVQIYQFSHWENTHFFAMEFIEGKTLEEILRIKRNKAVDDEGIPLSWSLDIIIQVLKALEFAHSKEVIHRDIKPANIMLDTSGRVFLTDFGLVKHMGREKLEAEGYTIGTPEYMSPEQAAGEPVDWRTDIYASGLVLYELISGQLPYQGSSPVSIIANRIVTQEIRRPTEFDPDIPHEIERIIMRSIARYPSERYQSALEMHDAVEKFRSEQKISEIVRSTAAKEQARAKVVIEKEKEKAQALILEEKLKATSLIIEEKKAIKKNEFLRIVKTSLATIGFMSIIYFMLFLIYDTRREEQTIKEDVAREIAGRIKQREASKTAHQSGTASTPASLPVPSAASVQQEQKTPAQSANNENASSENSLPNSEIDWINTQFQLGKNYEYAHRPDLAIESYIKIIRTYPDTKYAERARSLIQSLNQQR